jgi:hypothetical protein
MISTVNYRELDKKENIVENFLICYQVMRSLDTNSNGKDEYLHVILKCVP